MNAKIDDIMTTAVLMATPEDTFESVQKRIADRNVHCFPIVNDAGEPIGVITTSDLVNDVNPASPISTIMCEKVYTIPQYDDVSIAARIMRNHHIHHVIVTHEKKVVGIVSSFDLLKLVEDHRFTMKNPPQKAKHHSNDRH